MTADRSLALGVVLASGLLAHPGRAAEPQDAAAALFGLTKLHTVHLIVPADQWDAMEPTRRPDAGPRGFAGPGGDVIALAPRPGGGAVGTNRPPQDRFGPPGNFGRAFEEGRAARPGLAAMLGLDFPFVKGEIEFDGERVSDVGIRYKGNGTFMMSQGADKRPFKVDFNRHDKTRRFRGLTMLNFHNSVVDQTRMHETLGYALCREAGLPAPRTAYAIVSVTVPGRFAKEALGLYVMTEQVNDEFLENVFGTKKGLLVKPSSRDSLRYRGEDWAAYEKPLNVQENGSAADRRRMMSFLKLVNDADDETFTREAGEALDLDNTALFFALQVALVNLDSILTLGQNYYAYVEPKAGKLHWWLWDIDHLFGYFGFIGSPEDRAELSIARPWQGDNRLVERLLGLPEIQRRYREHLARLVAGPLSPAKLHPRIDALAAFLRPLVAREGEAQLAAFERAVPSPAPPGADVNVPAAVAVGSGPGGFPGELPNLSLKEFITRRAASIEAQLAGTSRGHELSPGGFGGPPRGGRFGGPGGFRPPAEFMAQPFLRDGDQDSNTTLSPDEFSRLADRWFSSWDAQKTGALDRDQLASGIGESSRPPGGPGFRPFGGPAVSGQRLRTNAPAAGPFGGPPRGGLMPFGPGGFLAPAFLSAGDGDTDGKLSAAELGALFKRWFKEWDANRDDALAASELGDGLFKMFPRPPGPPDGGTSAVDSPAEKSPGAAPQEKL